MIKHGGQNSLEVRCYQHLLFALIECDLKDLWQSNKQRARDIEAVKQRCQHEGVAFLTRALPSLGKALDKALSNDARFALPPGFSRREGEIPKLFGDLFARVFDADGEHLPVVCIRSVAGIRQLAYMFYKLELPYTDEQTRAVCNQFVEVDQGLPDPGSLDYRSDNILRMGRCLISSVLCAFDAQAIVPRHGPGSVSTGEDVLEKSKFSRIIQTLEPHYPFTEFFRFGLGHVCDTLDEIQALESTPHGCAKITLVPKDSRGPRIISMEPLEIQWIQQGLQKELYKLVERHPFTSGVVNFTDQNVNRSMAHSGSISPEWVTLDMKEASDRVSLALFEALFGASSLYEPALACRSHETRLPDGSIVKLKKFAPMGSALCFPVEALTFWALCVSALRTYSNWSMAMCRRMVYVFGDDLVVPYGYYKQIVSTLEQYGLLVNKDKCCIGQKTRFRESCGLDVLHGVDVTPLRVKRPITDKTHTWVPSWVDQSNLAYQRGYRGLAEAFADIVNTTMQMPYTTSKCGVLSFIRPYASRSLNTKMKFRYNRNLQRVEIKGVALRTKKARPAVRGYDELLRNWSDLISQSSEPRSASRETYSIRGTEVYNSVWSEYTD